MCHVLLTVIRVLSARSPYGTAFDSLRTYVRGRVSAPEVVTNDCLYG